MLARMGDPGNMLEGSSASMDDSCPWTEVSASNTQHASRNKQHLDIFPVFDRSLMSMGRQIGEGGQGCIYAAKFHLPYSFRPYPVVVKKFKPFEGVSQGHFPREMASVKSSNLCLPFGVFYEGDSLCMIMQHFSCDLRAAIDSRMKASRNELLTTNGSPFPEEVGRYIILQLAMGLKALHECGVYHGDLKAANILVKTVGNNYGTSVSSLAQVVIADFERSEGVVGTAFWRAPEVLRSLITEIPLSKEQWLLADIYSFGMVCYEVFTGMIPFQGHRVSDYDLVLNGGRPELPNHVPRYWRDLILRCWHVDPHSRPNWSEIMEVFVQYVDDPLIGKFRRGMNNFMSVELLSFESLIHELKQLIQDLTVVHESVSKSFRSEFIPCYWASEFVATAEIYASKFEVGSFLEDRSMCDIQEFFERSRLMLMLLHQMFGSSLVISTFINQTCERPLDMAMHASEIVCQIVRLQVILYTISQRVIQGFKGVKYKEEFEIGTSWIGKLLFFHAFVKWVLWYEHADYGTQREAIGIFFKQNSVIQVLLFFLCMMFNTYIYVLAMITYEPILLGLQYGLYKAKGCNNILYRSSGERICRFQQAWMNCTRYNVVSIILSFSFVILLTMYGLRGILGWILIPCVIIYTPYWQQPIIIK